MPATILFQNREYKQAAFAALDLSDSGFQGLLAGQQFIQSWLENKQIFDQKTSGSTGLPTNHQFHRDQFIASAKRTINALSLQPGSKALVCLNMAYIGGKMMLIRGFLGSWKLKFIAPDADLILAMKHEAFDFAAMVPLQVQKLLQTKEGINSLNHIKHLIIGGAAVSPDLARQIQEFRGQVYATYGMTETLSHVALQKLNGPDRTDYFVMLPGIEYDTDERGCLMLKADVTGYEWIKTNDIVQFQKPGMFKILGRSDNVINTGGVKVQTEVLEQNICASGLLGTTEFAIGSVPDPQLGQKIVLVTEGEFDKKSEILSSLKEQLPPYHAPKVILSIEALPKTPSDKLDRQNLNFWLQENTSI